ncbi:MAG: peptide chain release factor 1 [Candidatus Omnitrophica bacterium]|nr:peptide chain release factor 1 [Candidatus Omnitrophota bacterium]
MFKELNRKKEIYLELEKELSSSEVLSNMEKYKEKSIKYSNLKTLIAEYDKYLKLEEEKQSLLKMIKDEKLNSEYSIMAKGELEEVTASMDEIKIELEEMLLDENTKDLKKNVIMEIRAGTGGIEAGLFAAVLYKMYSKYIAEKGWKISVMSESDLSLGGIKEIIFAVEGVNVYKFLRFEKGTHRVQRVPETESGGRIHTSAATVAVLPEAEDVELNINPGDIRTDVFRSSGAGGQHVNVTDSAVRLTHIPTGVVVSCQDERSQLKNKIKAMRVLKARILETMEMNAQNERSLERKIQVGSGDRSEKIRTYNFPENRVTDHRIKLSLYSLDRIVEGSLDELIDALIKEDRMLKLNSVSK